MAQEAIAVAQRPLLFAAADMVDAIEREEDVSAFRQVRSPPDLAQILPDLRGSDAPLSPAQELAEL